MERGFRAVELDKRQIQCMNIIQTLKMEDDLGMLPTLGDLFKILLSDSLSTEKNTEVVQLINLRVGEFMSVCLSACLPGIYGNNFMISILSHWHVLPICLENFVGFMLCNVEQQFASERGEDNLVSCKSYTDLYCS